MIYRVTLQNIVWDNGKGEYDVSEGPRRMTITVDAHDRQSAVEYAMTEVDESYGCLIAECDASVEHIGDK